MQLKKSNETAEVKDAPTADYGSVVEKSDFPYYIVFGVWATWMLTLSFLLFNKYFISLSSGLASKSPFIFWSVTAWVLTPAWMFTWGVWLYNVLMDNKGGAIHKFFNTICIAYLAIPVVLQPILLIINIIAARDAPEFWTWWGLLFGSDIANLVLIYFTFTGLQLEYFNAESDAMKANVKKCYDDAGVEVDCLK